MSVGDRISRLFGSAGLLGYDRKYRELTARGISRTRARRQAEEWLQTCSKCHQRVSIKAGKGNKRQRADGGLDHLECAPISEVEET